MRAPVSVLLPCHRSERFVRRAVESVLSQSMTDWELVACDNASDDGTYEVLQEYAARDRRIVALRNETNVGPVGNWRRCAERATGRVAGLLFSDDWYEPEFLARMVPRLEDERVGLAYSAVRIVRADSPDAGGELHYLKEQRTLEPLEFVREACRAPATTTPVSPCCAIARRTDLVRWLSRPLEDDAVFGFSRHGAGPDLWVFLQACAEYPLLAHEPVPLVCFLSHESNLSSSDGVRRAYAAAAFQFSEFAPRFGKMTQRSLARAARLLRDTPLEPRIRRQLTLEGHIRLLAKGG